MPHTTEELAAELTAIAEEDHRTTPLAHSEDPAERLRRHRLTARHGDRLNAIMDEHGWPTADRFGADGAPVPWPVEDPAGLDARRAAAGIEPFAAYTARHAPGAEPRP
ncbi:hypothetical protein [Streptomyces carpaticus]|uniref:Uncharacterized protein n=1 Tax=Streptomyces carpaticus TaxID=285558 RepID=A0ABV4ZPC7_9ACTN